MFSVPSSFVNFCLLSVKSGIALVESPFPSTLSISVIVIIGTESFARRIANVSFCPWMLAKSFSGGMAVVFVCDIKFLSLSSMSDVRSGGGSVWITSLNGSGVVISKVRI